MGYMTNGLTFRTLRDGNVKRLPLFKTADPRCKTLGKEQHVPNCKCGRAGHSKPDGSDWPPASWLQAVIGELGEYANLRKKVERGDITAEDARGKLAAELADVVIYLDLLAFQLGIELGPAVMETWNAKSKQLGIPIYLDEEDWHYSRQLTDEEKTAYEPRPVIKPTFKPTYCYHCGLPLDRNGPRDCQVCK
jgi:NTP pyrophosphatase (non-canonical NTP hydrolase)